jgi:hypothetical protein
MPYRRFAFVMLLFTILPTGCKKQSSPVCEKLKESIATNNTEDAKSLITQFINRLPSADYAAQNLDNLAASLSQCSISATVLCFDCIQTLPSQSEIRLSFNSSGAAIAKTFDISYTPDNKMKVVNMHY